LKKIEIYELSETKKERNSIIHNKIIPELSIEIRSMDWATYSLTEKKKYIYIYIYITTRTNTIINKIEKNEKRQEKRDVFLGEVKIRE
jgi:L-rhamnose mutarotase